MSIDLEAEVARLTEENRVLRKTISIQEQQLKRVHQSDELRKLRAKVSEWEGSTQRFGNSYHHGDRIIRPYIDSHEDD